MPVIRVKVKPNSSRNQLSKVSETEWEVKIKAKPIDGEANRALIEFLSEELNIAKSKINIVKGLQSGFKTIQIQI
jgi:uncharacterized protein